MRARRLLAFAGHVTLGMSVPEIARALAQRPELVTRDLVEVQLELVRELERLGLPASTVLRRNPASFAGGDGI